MNDWRHWRLEQGEGGPAELFLSVADRSVNVLHSGVLDEFEDVLEHLSASTPSGVILGTDPGRAFALGADVGEFVKLESREQALAMLHRGQRLFEDWARLECPTVAAIRGHCLGGGLGTGAGLRLPDRGERAEDLPWPSRGPARHSSGLRGLGTATGSDG